METHGTESLVQKRQLLRAAAQMMAGALEGDARDAFLASSEARINRSYPAPSPGMMRSYLKASIVR